ncbi:MAG: F0F1 ATP synthase subunit delta [Opitutales bacterium]|nr:F0F1 ATP synthase subunit delta [Opitutales bacterium]
MTASKTAKILFDASLDASGSPDLERVRAVMDFARGRGVPLKILKEYLRLMSALAEKNSAKVFHAGDLSADIKKLLEEFARSKNPAAKPEFVRDDSLIGGVRAEIGDMVWENSVKMRLEGLAKPF